VSCLKGPQGRSFDPALPAQYCQEHTGTAYKRYCSASAAGRPPHFLQLLPGHSQGPRHCQSPRGHGRGVVPHNGTREANASDR
jgi:hypothetical protein